MHQREHLSVHDTLPRSHPLQVAVPVSAGISSRVRVVDDAVDSGRDGLESTVRVLSQLFTLMIYLKLGLVVIHIYLRESSNPVPMIHTVRCTWVKICPISFPRSLHFIITSRILIFMVHTKEEGIQSVERSRGQWFDTRNYAFQHI